MKNKIRTGIIGCGKVSDLHAKAYALNEKSDFVAVYDRNMEKAKLLAEKYHVKAYDSIQRMFNETGVEAVSICTPHPNHKDSSIEAAEAGIHIAVEKPLAVSLKDCDSIIHAARKNNIIGTTISQRRFFKPSLRIKQAIDEGKIGKPILGTVEMLGWRDSAYYKSDPWRGTWNGEGGGVLVNQSPHQLDLLLWYMGEIDELAGWWGNLNHPDIEVEDTAIAIIQFKNGALGNIVVSNSQNPGLFGKVHVHGSNGASIGVQTDSGSMFIAGMSKISDPPINDLWTIQGEEKMLPIWQKEDKDFFDQIDSTYYYHQCQINDFLNSILSDIPPLVTLEDGRKTVELFTAIYRSKKDHSFEKFPLIY
ncbi:MAG TPA: Gfo/Idh/MocA family oxidoreductase [Flexilinea sp.]|jgi:predicted dehydrogenase|nr:Gfo/Idh/MocA family oxidoreductase [Flexilinea sp.]HPJ64010.1 Gfo/Idh/MocA family oxidoreductase [Flexilinea sp.]HPR70536.1 Gfo/Idh/MocA family oxidoreductase [Flexilinea sp.]HQG88796.1 Gfo/Idh/MocA family oxidoreductase [Flexilinea sp.]HQJ01739.1 Gfo/Idh/MocA family oxidoreductase [Flexilinea sp.]